MMPWIEFKFKIKQDLTVNNTFKNFTKFI